MGREDNRSGRAAADPDTEGVDVEITIGVQNVARELVLESDQTADQVSAAVSAAIAGGTALTLTDARGRRIVVPTAVLGYVEIGTDEQRRVGFGAI
jgi:hypothetical protein